MEKGMVWEYIVNWVEIHMKDSGKMIKEKVREYNIMMVTSMKDSGKMVNRKVKELFILKMVIFK